MSEAETSKEMRTVIHNMLSNYEYPQTIFKYTGVTIETIETMRKELKPKQRRKDSIFKTVYQNKAMFLMFVQDFIKQDWVKGLTIEDLKLHPSLFPEILETDRESDVVYKITKDENEIFVFIMLENQSTVDYLMPFRLMEYMTRLWRKHIQDKTTSTKRKEYLLPAIVPIIFYDGEGEWTAKTDLTEIIDHKNLFQKQTPTFEYIVVDLKKISFEELEKLQDPQSLALMLDKIRTPEEVEKINKIKDEYWENVERITDKYNLRDLISQYIYLFMSAKKIDEEKKEEIMGKIRKGEVKKGMFAYSEALDVKKAEEKGRRKGKLEGKLESAVNLLESGFSLNQAAKSLKLTEAEILKYKKEQEEQ